MKGEWCYFKSYFSPETCNQILNLGLQLPKQNATLGVEGKSVDTQYRKSQTRFILKEHRQFNFLFDEMWKMAIKANEDWFGFHVTKIDYIQLAEYDSAYQGEYKKHHDVFWINSDPVYHRKLTAVVQLTDPSDYEGGDFEVYVKNMWGYVQSSSEAGLIKFNKSFKDQIIVPSKYSFIYVVKMPDTTVHLNVDEELNRQVTLNEGDLLVFKTEDFIKEESTSKNRIALIGSMALIENSTEPVKKGLI